MASKLGANVTGVALEPETKPNLFDELNLDKWLSSSYLTDIRSMQELSSIVKTCKPQVVFHLAAQPLVRKSYQDPINTWSTNVQGCINILESLRSLDEHCSVVMVTTDKVYENKEWIYGYRESDRLGGHDPYSASKAAAELAIASWRASFCGHGPDQSELLSISTARAGNVIGGGDWAEDRIIPDAIRALGEKMPIEIRNPHATRPWQHVLEPLSGYLCLAQELTKSDDGEENINKMCSAFNFGPKSEANKTVKELIEESLKYWQGSWIDISDRNEPHEAGRLNLDITKAKDVLNWQPLWAFEKTVEKTINWYKDREKGLGAEECCLRDIKSYQDELKSRSTKH